MKFYSMSFQGKFEFLNPPDRFNILLTIEETETLEHLALQAIAIILATPHYQLYSLISNSISLNRIKEGSYSCFFELQTKRGTGEYVLFLEEQTVVNVNSNSLLTHNNESIRTLAKQICQ